MPDRKHYDTIPVTFQYGLSEALRAYAAQHNRSLSAVVNMLVIRGLQAIEEDTQRKAIHDAVMRQAQKGRTR